MHYPFCVSVPALSVSSFKKISPQSQFLPQKDIGADGMQSTFMADMTIKTITSQHALPCDGDISKERFN